MIAYKIFLFENGRIKNLFKGIDGSRTLDYNTWYEADLKMVIDGKNTTPYLSGIHCLPTRELAQDYLKNFRTEKNRVIKQIEYYDSHNKPTNKNIILAHEIYVPYDWFNKINIDYIKNN